MTSPLPQPGMVLRASMLSRPYRAWGHILDGTDIGTAFSSGSATQATTPAFQVYDDRMYRFLFTIDWRSDVADTTPSWEVRANSGSGEGVLDTYRDSNAYAASGTVRETTAGWAIWTPAVNSASATFRISASRHAGTGTITPGQVTYMVEDIGPA